jgi:hypothetical protein
VPIATCNARRFKPRNPLEPPPTERQRRRWRPPSRLRRYGGSHRVVSQPSRVGRVCSLACQPKPRAKRAIGEGGGEGGIRTHVPLTGQDAFEAPPLRPLRYLSPVSVRARPVKPDTTYTAGPAEAGHYVHVATACRNDAQHVIINAPYRADGGVDARGGGGAAPEPKTFIAVAIMPAMSETVAGTITELAVLARLPNCSTYCSATRS